jgi:hypothetical protein
MPVMYTMYALSRKAFQHSFLKLGRGEKNEAKSPPQKGAVNMPKVHAEGVVVTAVAARAVPYRFEMR